jgi:single-stranded DNA-binding protein
MLNMLIAIGRLAKPPQVRSLPSGIPVASFDVQVVRPDQAPDIVPVALFDAVDEAAQWEAGQELLVIGRVRQRFFRVGGSTQSRTEVVADLVVALGQTEAVRAALVQAGTALAGVSDDLGPG